MKYLKILTIYLSIIYSLLLISSCSKGVVANAEEEFWVRGNCEMCKERIESGLTGISGVAIANWDIKTSLLKVEYDSNKVKPIQLHEACAKLGHETKLVAANEESHANLPECCQKGQTMEEPSSLANCCKSACCDLKTCEAESGKEKCGKKCCSTSSCQKAHNSCCKKSEIKS